MLLQASPASSVVPVKQQATTGLPIWVRKLTIGTLATMLVALCAHIAVLLPFTPIPITMQTFAVLLVGMVLEPFEAMAVLSLYLVEGAIGLPVFSPHGFGGVAQLLGTSGGYLLSYPLAALLAGTLFSAAKRFVPVFVASLIAAFIADGVILVSGAVWLAVSVRLSLFRALEVGAFPFIFGEVSKMVLIATAVVALQRTQRAD